MARTSKTAAAAKTEAQVARETIAEKIAKVLAKANGTSNEAEAATFLAKAEAMMTEHQLSFADLAELDKEDPTRPELSALTYWKSENWVGSLANALAGYYGLSAIRMTTGNQHHIAVVGRESAIETFKAMAPYLKKEVHRLSREQAKTSTETPSVISCAIGRALAIRLATLTAEAKAASEARVASGGMELVPHDAIAAIIERDFGTLKEGKSRRTRISAAAREAANSINLSGQIQADAGDTARMLAAE